MASQASTTAFTFSVRSEGADRAYKVAPSPSRNDQPGCSASAAADRAWPTIAAAAKPVMAKMREIPVNDVMTKNGKLREDGRLVRYMYLFQVKSPSESKSKDDIYKLLATVPGDEAYRPMKDGKCPYIK